MEINEKQFAAFISQQKRTNKLLEEILKELKKDNIECSNEEPIKMEDPIPELLENERNMPFAHVICNGYIFTFCYGRYVERKKATAQEIYMYRDASEGVVKNHG